MCDFCRKEHRTERHTEVDGISACIVKIIPFPAINLTTGETENTAKKPFFQIRFYDEDMEICIRTPNAFIYSLEKQPFEADSNGICFLCFDTEK